jgi:predicted RNA methylase
MTKQISLTQGLFTTVDDEDFEYLNQWKWHAVKSGKTFYAVRGVRRRFFKKTVYMHKTIMNPPTGMETDHKDLNGLNNTRKNLRNCAHTQNQQNREKSINNTSGYKGVCWRKHERKWHAQIRANGKKIHLGYYDNIEEAVYAYDKAAIKYHGEYASLNNVQEVSSHK